MTTAPTRAGGAVAMARTAGMVRTAAMARMARTVGTGITTAMHLGVRCGSR